MGGDESGSATDDFTPLERQQLDLADPNAQTFWHWVRFDIVTVEADRRGAETVADIGAGSGMLGDRLIAQGVGLRYRFQEASPSLDRSLGDRFGASARIGPADRVGATTVAAMLDVIEHIDDDVDMLSSWRARMDHGAALVVTVPALQSAYSSFDEELGHRRRYSRRQLRAVLEAAGFVVCRTDYLFPEMLPILIRRKLMPSRNTVDMPQLSPKLNRLGYAISSATARTRRLWPIGTSVVAIAEVVDAGR